MEQLTANEERTAEQQAELDALDEKKRKHANAIEKLEYQLSDDFVFYEDEFINDIPDYSSMH